MIKIIKTTYVKLTRTCDSVWKNDKLSFAYLEKINGQ